MSENSVHADMILTDKLQAELITEEENTDLGKDMVSNISVAKKVCAKPIFDYL